jgi:hypothetical protein
MRSIGNLKLGQWRMLFIMLIFIIVQRLVNFGAKEVCILYFTNLAKFE